GAMFGDNLSVISDTTIAATRSQGAAMRDKFRENFRIALPAALATIVVLAFLGDPAPVTTDEPASAWLVLPYVLVLALALAGLDVILVLGLGLAVAGGFGLALAPGYDVAHFAGDIWTGFEGMTEILLLSLLEGGGGTGLAGAGHRRLRARACRPAHRRGQHRGALRRRRRLHRQQHRGDPGRGRRRRRHRPTARHPAPARREPARHLRLRAPGRAALRRADPARGRARRGLPAGAGGDGPLLLDPARRGGRLHRLAAAGGAGRAGAGGRRLTPPRSGKKKGAPRGALFRTVPRPGQSRDCSLASRRRNSMYSHTSVT